MDATCNANQPYTWPLWCAEVELTSVTRTWLLGNWEIIAPTFSEVMNEYNNLPS